MNSLQNKIDFAVVLRVKRANPNGDPLNGNRPRTDYNGSGEISDVCLKRKLRDRLMEAGYNIFVQSDDRKVDGMRSLRERAEHDKFGLGKQAFALAVKKKKKGKKNAVDEEVPLEALGELAQKDETITAACAKCSMCVPSGICLPGKQVRARRRMIVRMRSLRTIAPLPVFRSVSVGR